LKLRLLKKESALSVSAQQLDIAELPTIGSLDDIDIMFRTAGNMLKDYIDLVDDPNAISALLDENIVDWTVMDFESLRLMLNQSGLDLLLSDEDQDIDAPTAEFYQYMLIDKSIMKLGFIPVTKVKVIPVTDFVEIIPIVRELLGNYNYFAEAKFVNDYLTAQLDSQDETYRLLSTYNQNDLTVLFSHTLGVLNKEILVLSTE
jgi:hypothetical protein